MSDTRTGPAASLRHNRPGGRGIALAGALLVAWGVLGGLALAQTTSAVFEGLQLTNPPTAAGTSCVAIDASGIVSKTGAACASGDLTGLTFTAPGIFSVSGSPCTSGDCTIGLTLASQSAYTVFGRGSGAGTPSFLTLEKSHLPAAVAYEDEANLFTSAQTVRLTTSPQLTLGYDASNYFTIGVGSDGTTTLGITTNDGTDPQRNGITTARALTIAGTDNTILEAQQGYTRLVLGLGSDSPRVLFEDAGSANVWQIDNQSGTFRWYLPSNTRMTMSSTALTNMGTFDTRGAISDGDSDLSLNDNVGVTGTLGVTGVASFSSNAQSTGYVSRTTGWAADSAGGIDARYGFFDEFHAKTFTAELTQAVNGSMTWTKSVTELAGESTVGGAATCPTAGGAAETWWFRDAPSAANLRIFQTGDYVAIRVLSWADGDANGASELQVSDCIVSVSAYADGTSGNDGYQSWTVTRPAAGGGAMANGGSVPLKSQALNFGATGDGFLFATVSDGANNVNAPYFGSATWATTPAAANWTTRARLGQLRGITATDEYGLLAGTYGNGPSGCVGGSTCTAVQFFRASDQSFDLHGIDFTLWDANSANIILRRNSGNPYLAIGNPAPTTYGATTGVWMGSDSGTYRARIGDPSGNRLLWDGTSLTLGGSTSEQVVVDATSLKFQNNGTTYGELSGSTWTLGPSGAPRIEITSSAVNLKNSSGTDIITLSGTTGTITGATVQTATSGARVVLDTAPSLKWYSSGGATLGSITGTGIELGGPLSEYGTNYVDDYGYTFHVPAAEDDGQVFGLYAWYIEDAQKVLSLRSVWDGASTSDIGNGVVELVATSRSSGTVTTTASITLLGTSGQLGIRYNVDAGGTHTFTGPAYVGGALDVTGTIKGLTGGASSNGLDMALNDSYANLRVLRNATSSIDKHMYIGYQGGTNSDLYFYSDNTNVMTLSNGDLMQVAGNVWANGVQLLNWTAYASALRTVCTDANANGADAYIYYYNGACSAQSSRRYKQNIVPATEDWARVLDIQPVEYDYIAEPGPRHVGAIAEDVADLGGLSGLIIRDDQGRPDGLNYDRMSLYLIPVVREQRDRIAALEARLAALEQAAKPTFFMNCRVDPAFPHLTTCY